MALRVTQNMLYNSSVSGMNRTLSDLMDSNIQSASQLKINKPSDDPVGAARVISYRATLNNISTYQDNISEAKGWLSTADSVLSSSGSVQTILTSIKSIAEQGATGTYTAENREQMSYDLRQLYEQLITVANTSYNGSYIFSGQKTGTQAYAAALGVSYTDSGTDLDDVQMTANGGATYTVLFQATSSGTASTASWRYTPDGGSTWIDVPASDVSLGADGKVTITGGGVSLTLGKDALVNAVDTDNLNSTDNGTWLYVRPTAVYQGDDSDTQVVIPYGSTSNTAADVSASGSFARDVTIRIDGAASGQIQYSYSTDDGSTWTSGTASSGPPTRLFVAGGYLDLANTPLTGEQYVIHPHRADISLAISETDSITVNVVGKDVFGGLYANPATGELEVVQNRGNIFEIVGNLIAAAETNNQQGMQEALTSLNDAMNVVLTKAAVVGGRENRLVMASSILTTRQIAEEDALSAVQDVDVTELMTRLAQQQIAYNSVLKSSSMIMQMSLVNFL